MISISFEKWHGCKNDFIVIQGQKPENQYLLSSLRRQAPLLCNKTGAGIGADGILYLRPQGESHELIVINSDGSLAQNCGNGLRCAAAFLWKAHPPREGEEVPLLQMQVGTSNMNLQWVAHQERESCTYVMVDMPAPQGNPAEAKEAAAELKKILTQQSVSFTYDSLEAYTVGNRHLLLWGPDATESTLQKIGQAIRGTSLSETYNLHLLTEVPVSPHGNEPAWVQGQVSEAYRMLSWERGVGFTPACGSGACSAGVAVLEKGFAPRESWISIETPGGPLWVQQRDQQGEVRLLGPAVYVYSGLFFL